MEKKVGMLALILVGILALSGLVSALPNETINFGTPITIESVKVDDFDVSASGVINTLGLDRNMEFPVKVVFTASADIRGMQVEAYIRGYDHPDMIQDITDVFDAKAGVTYTKRLTLKLPQRIDIQDDSLYLLRIRIEGQNGGSFYEDYKIDVGTARHSVDIRDIILTPETSVLAGRALLASVRVQNYGEDTEEGIKVQVSIPDLDVSASGYIDELRADESASSEELYLRIPADAKVGVYTVLVEVTYSDGDETVTKETTIKVESDGTANAQQPVATGPETIITVGPESQDVTAGQSGVIYPLTITNKGQSSKTYTIAVDGVSDWGNSKISPSNVLIVNGGETKAAYISVGADAATPAGPRMFGVSVSSNSEILKQIPLTANVIAAQQPVQDLFGFRRGLEIGLVVLVVLLVIIGLIIGFNKLKGNEEEESDEKTYY